MYDYEIKLFEAFPGSFINSQGEFIAEPKTNQYFILRTCKNEFEVKCKVLEWFSRPAHYTQPGNKKLHKFMLDGINKFLDTNFTYEDVEIIYCELGNGVNRSLCEKFIKSGYDMALLSGQVALPSADNLEV